MSDTLYWEDGHRYFNDIDDALEYFFDEPEAEIPETLQPCKPVECSETLATRLADEVIDYIGDNCPEMACEDYDFAEVLTKRDKDRLVRRLRRWVTQAASVLEPDYKAESVRFKEDALAYRTTE